MPIGWADAADTALSFVVGASAAALRATARAHRTPCPQVAGLRVVTLHALGRERGHTAPLTVVSGQISVTHSTGSPST